MNELFQLKKGSRPLLVSIPHAGTWMPDSLKARLRPTTLKLPDTDWFVDRLYDLPVLGECSWIAARVSRYLIDLNRPPTNESLYPGQNTTELCPTVQFSGEPLYVDAQPFNSLEIEQRIETYWRPYHDTLKSELDRLRKIHGQVVLFDAHSIASKVPRLFPGTLTDFNFGTNHGKSCSPEFQKLIEQFARESLGNFSHVVNGRFVGGYITRAYGNPAQDVQAFQLELSQATYLDESQRRWDDQKSRETQSVLSRLIQAILNWMSE